MDINKINLQDNNSEVCSIAVAEYQTSFNVLHNRVVLQEEILARRMLPLFVCKHLMWSHKEDLYLRLVNIHKSNLLNETDLIGRCCINVTDETPLMHQL